MTILAGVMSRRDGQRLGDDTCEALRGLLSRHPGDDVLTYRDDHCFLAKVDIGAFGTPAFRVDISGTVAMLAGEPLLAPGEASSRTRDLERLHSQWDRGSWDALPQARGVFCAVHYQPATCSLTLLTDKLGVRPLYYWITDRYVAFATQLRILERLPLMPKRLDLRGVAEMTTLGYPLGARTPYENIALLRAAEIVCVTPSAVRRSTYWRWDEVAVSARSEDALLDQAYKRFGSAVAARLGGDRATVAFLSGGLDSRCVVASLRSRGAAVHSFNFAQPGAQDQAFASQFAARIGTQHREAPLVPEDEMRWSAKMGSVWDAVRAQTSPIPERPQIVWSGDGGSVALGHVYIEPSIVYHLRRGQRDSAVEAFLDLQGARLIRRIFHREAAHELASMPGAGVREELDSIRCADPVHAFYLFLMLNDQRRHLSAHFEGQDLHRLEFHLPFFDSEFLRIVTGVPVDWCLRHGFYTKWLSRFPPEVRAVPWQAYPGHVPCPIPAPPGLSYQWKVRTQPQFTRYRKKKLLGQAAELLRAPTFPKQLLRKRAVWLAATLYRLGIRDYGYVLAQAASFGEYWSSSAF
jgi:hypothetical protein